MAYATASDLKEVLSEEEQIQLTDDDASDGEAKDSDILKKTLSRSESIVDSYLSKRFDLPLSTVPESVKDATLIIAKKKLYDRRPGSMRTMEDISKAYDDAVAWLRDVAVGNIDLPEVSSESDDVASSGLAGVDSMKFSKQIF